MGLCGPPDGDCGVCNIGFVRDCNHPLKYRYSPVGKEAKMVFLVDFNYLHLSLRISVINFPLEVASNDQSEPLYQ